MADSPRKKPALNVRQSKFVEGVLAGKTAKAAAIAAGYSERSAGSTARDLMRTPSVRAEIDKARASEPAERAYTYSKAMSEYDRCIKLAEETKNSMAMAKAIEGRSKLSGLWQERHLVQNAGFHIMISGINDSPAMREVGAVSQNITALIGSNDEDETDEGEF